MTDKPRRLTINSRGDIVPVPYGPSRWSSPRRYICAHTDCPNAANVLRTADAHPAQVGKTHNCCDRH